MKLIEAVTNNIAHYMTEEMIISAIELNNLDPNKEVEHGDKITLGSISFMVYDDGRGQRKLLETAKEEPASVVCPTCNGEGVVQR